MADKQIIQTESKRVIMLPKKDIVCAREYPMTEHTSTQLRLIRDHFEKLIFEETGEQVSLPFPTALAYLCNDYCRVKGIESSNDND